jgi:hypothetical protein
LYRIATGMSPILQMNNGSSVTQAQRHANKAGQQKRVEGGRLFHSQRMASRGST